MAAVTGFVLLADPAVFVPVHRGKRGVDGIGLLAETFLLKFRVLDLVNASVVVGIHGGECGVDVGLLRVGR